MRGWWPYTRMCSKRYTRRLVRHFSVYFFVPLLADYKLDVKLSGIAQNRPAPSRA